MKPLLAMAFVGAALGFSRPSATALRPAPAQEQRAKEASASMGRQGRLEPGMSMRSQPRPEPKTVLMRSGQWFVYPGGCEGVAKRRDVILHFHGAHTTVIPRFLKSNLDAVLVIINKGIGSGAYSNALGIRAQVDALLGRVEATIASQCGLRGAPISRLALSSWSAGYGAVEQILRWRPERVDAVLLADGLHVGFVDPRTRQLDPGRLDVFRSFARSAGLGKKLMTITHSAIMPVEYAGTGETARVLSEAASAPTWPVAEARYGMRQITASRRGQFYAEGFAGTDKQAHAGHLYAIGNSSFARLRSYWES